MPGGDESNVAIESGDEYYNPIESDDKSDKAIRTMEYMTQEAKKSNIERGITGSPTGSSTRSLDESSTRRRDRDEYYKGPPFVGTGGKRRTKKTRNSKKHKKSKTHKKRSHKKRSHKKRSHKKRT